MLPRHPLANCVDYGDADAAFSDCFSAVAISPAGTSHVGLARLYHKGIYDTAPDFAPLAELHLQPHPGAPWEPFGVTSRVGYPWGWVETGLTATHEVEQEVCFASPDTIRVRWNLRALVSGAASPRLGCLGALPVSNSRLVGEFTPEALRLHLDRHFLHRFKKIDARFVARFALVADAPMLAGGFHHGLPAAAPSGLISRLEPANRAAWWLELPLAPDASAPGAFTTGLTVLIAYGDRALLRVQPSSATLAAAEERWHAWLARIPAPRPDTLEQRRRLAQCLAVLVRCAVRHPGYGNFSDDLVVLAKATTWASTGFLWDHLVSSATLALVDPAWQASAIHAYSRHTTGGRMTPGILLAYPEYGDDNFLDSYAPIASWAVATARRAGGAHAPLAELYPRLAAINQSWFDNCDRDGDGIPEWRNTGNPADDSPLYDAYSPRPGGKCFPIPPFPSVNLIAYLLLDSRLLAGFARELGLAADAARWDARVAFLENFLLEKCWDADDLFFYDLNPSGERVRIRTFFGLLPLWAGLELPGDTARRAIERHLLDPKSFFGEIPFPSVAYDEPTYNPDGYWRGRSWPHVYFWNTELLHRHGYTAEAERAREIFVRLQSRWKTPVENFSCDPRLLHKPGNGNYNWGAATCVHFLADWHRVSPLPDAAPLPR
jgi:hypothetical protein